MLDTIKNILIDEKKNDLKIRKEINQEISKLKKEIKQDLTSINNDILNLEKEISLLNKNILARIINYKELKSLNDQYRNIITSKTNKLEQYDNIKNTLLNKIYHNNENTLLIENEINRIKNASSLEELGFNNETAQTFLRQIHNHQEYSTIQKVFSSIDTDTLNTKEDVNKYLYKLCQVSTSSFIVELKKMSPKELSKELIEIGILIEDNKLDFLNQLYKFQKKEIDLIPVIEKNNNNEIDNYYYDYIEKMLSALKNNMKFSPIMMAQIMTLTVLTSMVKLK